MEAKQFIFRLINFIKQQWLGAIFFVLFILYLISFPKHSEEKKNLEKKTKEIKSDIKKVDVKIDSLSKEIIYLDKKIKITKEEENEKIKSIDTMSISSLQEFFSKRYSKR